VFFAPTWIQTPDHPVHSLGTFTQLVQKRMISLHLPFTAPGIKGPATSLLPNVVRFQMDQKPVEVSCLYLIRLIMFVRSCKVSSFDIYVYKDRRVPHSDTQTLHEDVCGIGFAAHASIFIAPLRRSSNVTVKV
jgi:hypothetical protein